jgi:hypothetical protein
MNKTFLLPPALTPRVFANPASPSPSINFEYYANPIFQPTTGKTISSYRKLMNNPATAEVWQTAFGKKIRGMAHSDNKTGQKGTNAMFVMTHDKIAHAYCKKKFFTFANPVVNYRPKTNDPNCIQITAMGNFITYDRELSIHTADINTVKLH